jgi:hypothetical protein
VKPAVEDGQGGPAFDGRKRGERLRQVEGQLLGEVSHCVGAASVATQSVTARRFSDPASESAGAVSSARTASCAA